MGLDPEEGKSYPLEELREALNYGVEQAAKELASVDPPELKELGEETLKLLKKLEQVYMKHGIGGNYGS